MSKAMVQRLRKTIKTTASSKRISFKTTIYMIEINQIIGGVL